MGTERAINLRPQRYTFLGFEKGYGYLSVVYDVWHKKAPPVPLPKHYSVKYLNKRIKEDKQKRTRCVMPADLEENYSLLELKRGHHAIYKTRYVVLLRSVWRPSAQWMGARWKVQFTEGCRKDRTIEGVHDCHLTPLNRRRLAE